MRIYYKGYKISMFVLLLGLYFTVVILGVVDLFSIGSILKYIAFLPILGAIGKHIYIGKGWKAVFLYYIFAIASFFWSINTEMSQDTAIAYISLMLLLLFAMTQTYNEGEIAYLKKSLLWSSRISLVVSWMFANFSGGRLIIHESIMKEDPNYLCAYFYFGIAFCMEAFFVKKKIRVKLLSISEILLYLLTILFTGSRGGLFGGVLVAGIVYLRTTNIKSISSIISKLLFIFILLLLLPLVISVVNPDVMERFSADAIENSDGSGRYEIWNDAINAYCNYDSLSLLIGKGMGASRAVASLYHFSRVNVMHNVFLENLIGLGCIGSIMYIYSQYVFLKKSFYDYFAFAVFVGMFVLGLSTSILYLKPFWNSLLFIACVSMNRFYIKSNSGIV